MNGLLIVDKPIKKTSFDMIRDVRKEYNIKKVGHIGTLDPMATGVLPILIGEATKLSDYLMEHDKEYISTIQFGEKRDTGDQEGTIIEEKSTPKNITIKTIEEILNSFLGETMQTPPMYSALKVNGKKLYDLARKGIEVERKARKIIITEIELLEVNEIKVKDINCNKIEELNNLKYRVVCSKGTYIRVLCEDISKKLQTCGYMSSLNRTRVGSFKIEDAGKIIEMQNILDVPKIKLELINNNTNKLMKELLNGIPIEINESEGLVNLFLNEKYIGIGEIKNNKLKRKIIV